MSTTPNVLAPPPVRTPISGSDGTLSVPWVNYFQSINSRVGGPVSQTLVQVAANVATLQTDITAINTEVATLTAEQVSLAENITTLSAEQATQAADIATIQAELAAGLSVTVTTAKLTTGGADGSMTFTNGLLTAQVQAT